MEGATSLVLVVDDRIEAREFIHDLLDGEGYSVLEAENGEEALALAGRNPVQLIITDLHMPGLDGMGLLERIGVEKPGLPVIIVTGNGRLAVGLRALARGAFYFLEKPVKTDKLLDLVKKALARTSEQVPV